MKSAKTSRRSDIHVWHALGDIAGKTGLLYLFFSTEFLYRKIITSNNLVADEFLHSKGRIDGLKNKGFV
ncbi:MAG: hypothetical protein JXB49_36735 [Bacteroidales bacterium]|nr:hypothetical protein [Bacteroidales bacterium]